MISSQAAAADLADAIRQQAVQAGIETPAVRGADWRQAIVASVGTGTVVTTDGITARRLESYANPTAGDRIVVSVSGSGNWLAAGRVATTTDTAWTAYTPTWQATTTNPALGNGTIVGRWARHGRTIHFNLELTAGSTTTFGSGSWRVSLPVAKASDGLTTPAPARMNVAGGNYFGVGEIASADTFVRFIASSGGTGSALNVSSTQPATWTNGDRLRICGTYEAAS